MSLHDIPVGPGSAHVKAFVKAGWTSVRQSGDHEILTKPGHEATLSVPLHRPEVRRGTIAKLVEAAGLTQEEYRTLFYGKAKPSRHQKKKASTASEAAPEGDSD